MVPSSVLGQVDLHPQMLMIVALYLLLESGADRRGQDSVAGYSFHSSLHGGAFLESCKSGPV